MTCHPGQLQEDPKPVVGIEVPTKIGLTLLSTVAERDFAGSAPGT